MPGSTACWISSRSSPCRWLCGHLPRTWRRWCRRCSASWPSWAPRNGRPGAVGGGVLRQPGDPHAEHRPAGRDGRPLPELLRRHAGLLPQPGHDPHRPHPLPARRPRLDQGRRERRTARHPLPRRGGGLHGHPGPPRLGVQIGLWQKAWVKATPSATSRSSRGVWTCGLPSAPTVSKRCWSVQYQRMFGAGPGIIPPKSVPNPAPTASLNSARRSRSDWTRRPRRRPAGHGHSTGSRPAPARYATTVRGYRRNDRQRRRGRRGPEDSLSSHGHTSRSAIALQVSERAPIRRASGATPGRSR